MVYDVDSTLTTFISLYQINVYIISEHDGIHKG